MTETEKNKGGRPTDYSLDLATEICETIASNSMGVKRLCAQNEHWPDHSTIYRWLMKYPEFSDLYARAKDHQAEVLVDEIIDIADDSSQDEKIIDKPWGEEVVLNREFADRSRIRIDARKWCAAHLRPRKYGDKIQTEVTGKNGAPIEYAELTAEERKQRALELLDTARARRADLLSSVGRTGEEGMETVPGAAEPSA